MCRLSPWFEGVQVHNLHAPREVGAVGGAWSHPWQLWWTLGRSIQQVIPGRGALGSSRLCPPLEAEMAAAVCTCPWSPQSGALLPESLCMWEKKLLWRSCPSSSCTPTPPPSRGRWYLWWARPSSCPPWAVVPHTLAPWGWAVPGDSTNACVAVSDLPSSDWLLCFSPRLWGPLILSLFFFPPFVLPSYMEIFLPLCGSLRSFASVR